MHCSPALARRRIHRSDEMIPEWFSLSDDSVYARRPALEESDSDTESALSDSSANLPHIPYDRMWADDVYWLSHLVRGVPFVGRCDFDEGNVMKRFWFGSVSSHA